MKTMTCGMTAAWAILLGTLGCEAPELSDAATSSSPAPPPVEPAAEPAQPRLFTNEPLTLPPEKYLVTDVPRKVDPTDPVKGRHSRAEGGVAGNFGAALWAQHKAIYDAISYANQLYWPQHNFSYPKSHEEFMSEVVASALNGQELPELAPGREYIYVPEQGEVGLQIRLTPGSPGSKLPPPEPGKEHIFDAAAAAEAGALMPGSPGEPAGGAPPVEAAAGPTGGETTEEQPRYDIRSRAEALGEQGNSRIEEHGLAPGGLVPVGGLE